MKRLRLWLVVALVAPWATPAALAQQDGAPPVAQEELADQPVPQPAAADDEQAIRANADKYVELYNRRDAQGMADMWSPEAVYTDSTSGEAFTGREAIAEHFAQMFAGMEDARLKVTVDAVEFVSPNVAIERGTAVVSYPEQESEESTYTAVHVKRDGQWLIDRISEEAAALPPPSNYEHLKALEWMIGDWIDSDEQATVETSVAWTKNQNFLRRSFAVVTADDIPLSGVQLIGWDPNDKCIRSWTFDSDGGFAEATWSREGSAWHIRNKAILPGGGVASAVNILTEVDGDSFLWESVSREVDGQLLPNVEAVLIVRSSAAGSAGEVESAQSAASEGLEEAAATTSANPAPAGANP